MPLNQYNPFYKAFRVTFLIFLLSFFSVCAQNITQNLFNGKNFDGWYIFLEKRIKNIDPNKVFSVDNNMIHISGGEFGYLGTIHTYQNFKLLAEYRCVENTSQANTKAKKSGGILYHVAETDADEVWPKSIGFQIAYGASGDFLVSDGINVTTKHKTTHTYGLTHIYKSSDCERPVGEWNTVEIISNNGKCSHILNGMVINEITDVQQSKGKILLKSDGSEMYFRKIVLMGL